MPPRSRLLRWTAAAALLAAAAAPPLPGDPAGGGVARLDLERGRALLVDGAGVTPLRRSDGTLVVLGRAHLELAPGARALVRWPGQASVALRGPASFAWGAESGEGLRWDFSALQHAEVEIRTREARIELPDAWRLELARGAYTLEALPGGGSRLDHHAGRPARATWIGGVGVSPPPFAVSQGESVRLAGTPRVTTRADRTPGARRWDASSWPWGEGGIPDLPPGLAESQPPWPADDWPWQPPPADLAPWERWDWPWRVTPAPSTPSELGGDGTVDPFPSPPWSPGETEPPAQVSAPLPVPFTPPAPAASDGTVGDEIEEEEAPAAPPEPAPYDPALWRGLPEEQTEDHGTFRVQRSDDWVIEELPSGRTELRLERETLEPAWFLGREVDYRVFPGAALVLEPDGRVRFHRGWVRVVETPPGRGL